MPSKKSINTDLIIRCDTEYLSDNIIGVAVSIENSEVNHSGVFIRYNQINYFLHFDTQAVRLVEVPEGAICFFKQLDFIPGEMIPSIFAYFDILQVEAKPQYGFFYTGSFYDNITYRFIDINDMPEIMSCVGFCLNVLKTVFRQSDFIKYQDWYYHNGITQDKVFRYFQKAIENFPNITLEEFAKHVRRILPIEYFTAGFSEDLPVRKAFTDLYINETNKAILSKV